MAQLFEKCEQATQSADLPTSASFDVDIEEFVHRQEREGRHIGDLVKLPLVSVHIFRLLPCSDGFISFLNPSFKFVCLFQASPISAHGAVI